MRQIGIISILTLWAASGSALVAADPVETPEDAQRVDWRWDVRIPLRDGVHLSAIVYTPKGQEKPSPCLFTLTPYIAQHYHERGVYFAAHGLPFLSVDVRGRGNSEGVFEPLLQEAQDGYDVVEWLARQPYCNGKVGMWGGSYAGYDQWATAKEFPPHLATIAPAAAPYAGVDFPARKLMFDAYDMQWLTFTGGHTSQDAVFADRQFWVARQRQWFESGMPFRKFDAMLGNPSPIFQRWLSHPTLDSYWDSYNPTAEQYGKLSIPILTITGSYDGDQPGALEHYREHMKHASPQERARHYLVIGPWDHDGTRTPSAEFGGLKFGPESLVDLRQLHLDWYNWTMSGGPRPQFLKKPVAYYVMQADKWRYAESLEGVTSMYRVLHLDSTFNPSDVLASGTLGTAPSTGKPDHFLYDPRDLGNEELDSTVDPDSLTEQREVYAARGKQLVYHSAAFEADTEISGFFRFSAWIGIDQPDTDFAVSVYEILPNGASIRLSSDQMRARYRESARAPHLVSTQAPLHYEFNSFTFVSRKVQKGSRLRLVLSSINSIRGERNFNSGGVVAEESMADARPVVITLYHDRAHPSALQVPLGQPED